MKIQIPEVLITLENETDRYMINVLACVAIELVHDSIRTQKVNSRLIQAGYEPRLENIGDLRRFAEEIADMT